MFKGLFAMHETCKACRFRFEREPGYFLGSIYVNYGVTSLISIAGWVTLQFGFGFRPRTLVILFSAFCLLFCPIFFRFARALWLALDCRWDASIFDEISQTPSGRCDHE
jgi:Protein of unknown function (DUF983)